MDELYRVRKGQVAIVDVPELGYLSVQGRGVPGGPEFQTAARLLRTATAGCTHRMPIEALWSVDDGELAGLVRDVAQGRINRMDLPAEGWSWQALLRVPDPAAGEAIALANAAIRYLRWTEGLSVQVLHVGPYTTEGPAVLRLYAAIDAAGWRPRGRHHEIYLSERPATPPRRMATVLRQPVEAPRLRKTRRGSDSCGRQSGVAATTDLPLGSVSRAPIHHAPLRS